MASNEDKYLEGGDFFESFLVDVQHNDWPNEIVFLVWSPNDEQCYRITTRCVIECHYIRTGTGDLQGEGGIPLENIYQVQGEDYDYWMQRILAYTNQGYDSGDPPICLEFDSHLFANRKKQMMTRDRDTGLLVVCRSVTVEVEEG